MLKQIKYIRIDWNDSVHEKPEYCRDMTEAAKLVAERLRETGSAKASTFGVSIRPEIRILNMDNPADAAWWASRVGKTCSEFGLVQKPEPEKTREIQMELDLSGKNSESLTAVPPVLRIIRASSKRPTPGYETAFNPARQEAGAKSARRHVFHAPSPDRRPKGTVNVARMDVETKRDYWRWSKARARCRAAGVKPIGWADWTKLPDGRAGEKPVSA